ncbi:MAG: hypothetical protein V9G18_12900 [Albidovulum sp.]
MLIGIVSAKRTAVLAVDAETVRLGLGAVADTASSSGSTTSVTSNVSLEVGFVPAGERPPAVGGLHLAGRDLFARMPSASLNVLRYQPWKQDR